MKRAVGSNDLYFHNLEHCIKIDPVRGSGLYLTPHERIFGVHGDELYLKHGATIQDVSGLILGPNSPFKNIFKPIIIISIIVRIYISYLKIMSLYFRIKLRTHAKRV